MHAVPPLQRDHCALRRLQRQQHEKHGQRKDDGQHGGGRQRVIACQQYQDRGEQMPRDEDRDVSGEVVRALARNVERAGRAIVMRLEPFAKQLPFAAARTQAACAPPDGFAEAAGQGYIGTDGGRVFSRHARSFTPRSAHVDRSVQNLSTGDGYVVERGRRAAGVFPQLSSCLNRLRTSPSISASRSRRSSMRRTAWMTVEWSRPPNLRPISG